MNDSGTHCPYSVDGSRMREFVSDPQSAVAHLRSGSGVRFVKFEGREPAWLVTDPNLARSVLRDSRFVKTLRGDRNSSAGPRWRNTADLEPRLFRHMLNEDGADHSRLRGAVSSWFSRASVESLLPTVEACSLRALERLEHVKEFDLVADYCLPYSYSVIAEILGISTSSMDDIVEAMLVVGGDSAPSDREFRIACDQLVSFIDDLLHEADSEDRPGLLRELRRSRVFSDDEVSSLVFLLLIAGYETTANLMANFVFGILHGELKSPALMGWEQWVEYFSSELPSASSFQTTTHRRSQCDLDLGGRQVRRGDLVVVYLMSVNGSVGTELASCISPFGYGPHFCLGRNLAVCEATVGIRLLFQRFPLMALIEDRSVGWREDLLIRGPVGLWCRGDGGPVSDTCHQATERVVR